jgi:hypothetical protein
MSGQLLLAERRPLGLVPLVVPVLAAVAVALVAGLLLAVGTPGERVVGVLVGGLETVLPLSAGLAAATAVTVDPSIELQLATATPFARTVARRLTLVLAVGAACGLAWTLAMLPLPDALPQPFARAQLVWAPPLLWMTGAGALLALALGSRNAAGTLLAGWWVVQHLGVPLLAGHALGQAVFLSATTHVGEAPFWLANRAWLTAGGVLLLAGTGALAHNPDRLLRREDG